MAWFDSSRQRSTPDNAAELEGYAPHYSEPRFWSKISRVAKRAGYELVEKALWLHYAARRPDTPAWAKATAYGALAYFILPLDAIPDWVPGFGYTDDLGALILAVATISQYIDDDVRARAATQLNAWFGTPEHHRTRDQVS